MRNKYVRLLALIIICSVLSAGCSTGASDIAEAYNIIDCSVKKTASAEIFNSSGDSVVCGSAGDGASLEYISLALRNPAAEGGIDYKLHIQSVGWTDWFKDGSAGGEQGSGKRIEAVQIQLRGEIAVSYNICYRVYVTDMGWCKWAANGEAAGTEGMSKGIEAIEIKLVSENGILPEENSTLETDTDIIAVPEVDYSIYLQDSGWISENNEYAGIPGGEQKAEGFSISITDNIYGGSIVYRAYMETYGWLDWVSGSAYSGIYNESKRMEALQINLTDELARYFDIYYRVYVGNRGWLGWAVNGQSAGTSGFRDKIDAYQIILKEKGEEAPGETVFSSIAAGGSAVGADTLQIIDYAVSRLKLVGRYYVEDTEAFKNRYGDYNGTEDNSGKGDISESEIKAYCESSMSSGLVQADVSQAGDDIAAFCSDKILEFYADKDSKATFYIEFAGCTMDNVLVFKCYYNRG